MQLCLLHHIQACRCPQRRLLQTSDSFSSLSTEGSNKLFMFTGSRLTKRYSLGEVNRWHSRIQSFKKLLPSWQKKILFVLLFFFAKLLAAIDKFSSRTCDVWVCGLIRKRLRKPFWCLWIHMSKNNCGGVWISEGEVFISLFLCPRQMASNSNSDLKYFSLYANSVPRRLDGPYSRVKYWLDLHREAFRKKLCLQRV